MIKKTVAFIVAIAMIAVMALGFAKHNKLLIFEEKETVVLSDEEESVDEDILEEESKILAQRDPYQDIQEFVKENWEKLPFVNMGERREVYDHIGITINSAYQTDRVDFIPEELKGRCTGIDKGGYCDNSYVTNEEDKETFVVMDIDIENLDSDNNQEFNLSCISVDIGTEPDEPCILLATTCYVDKVDTLENREDTSRYHLDMNPGEEFHTKMVISLPIRVVAGEMDFLIEPRENGTCVGAARYKVVLENL